MGQLNAQWKVRFSTGLGPFGPSGDRYCLGGYRDSVDIPARLRQAAKVKGLDGVELHYPMMFGDIAVGKMKTLLGEYGLECSLVSATVWHSMKWRRGSLTNPDARVRAEAVKTIQETMDVAEELGAYKINLWLGQDGFDYPFQTDYRALWSHLVDGLKQCAEHNPRVGICLEAKPKEPRTHLIVATVGKILYLANKVGLPSVGANLDVGHALMAYENPSETAYLLKTEGRLFHLHFNDNYGDWDWDMIPGSCRPWELLEVLFWLRELEYEGWYSLDFSAPREDPVKATEISIQNIKDGIALIDRLDREAFLAVSQEADYPRIGELLRAAIFC